MDFTNGANGGLGSGGLYMANLNPQQAQQQFVPTNPQMLKMPQQQTRLNPSSLTGAPMSNGDFQNLMMGSIGSVMPSSQTIASFMHKPQDMLCVGSSANAIFDPSQTLKNSNSNALLSMQQANNSNSGQNMFFNQNALFQQQQQQQQLNKMPQAMPQPQQAKSSHTNNNVMYQNAMFEQQRQQLQQQHELQRQQLKQQQALRLQEHESQQKQKTRNSSSVPATATASSLPQQQQKQQLPKVKPQRAVAAPVVKENTAADSNNDSFTNFTTDFFDMPNQFTDIDDDMFSLCSLPAPSPQAKKRKDAPPRSINRPPTTTISRTTSISQPMRVSVSPPSARSSVAPTSVSSSSQPLLLPPRKAASSVTVKKAMHLPAPSLLHQACFLYPTTAAVVVSALGVESNNVRRRVPTPAPSLSMDDTVGDSNKRRKLAVPYSLPLHIALDNDASKDVIEALIKAGPDVIAMTDGPDGCTALSVALYKSCSPETIALLVKANPNAVQLVDRHQNTALHVGCSKGASIEVMKMLHTMHPKALLHSNFHSQTPLDVAQRTNVCPISVIDFLQELVLESLERRASHLVTSDDDELV